MRFLSRRQLMTCGMCLAMPLALPHMAWGKGSARALSFYNLHTGETAKLTYVENGSYIPDAMAELNRLLRDYRTGDVHDIDPALLDQLFVLQQAVDTPGAYHVISGYRSPVTNQTLHTQSDGVAKKSLHMEGRAIDIRLPGKDLTALRKAALAMKAGGVGYYPASNFIHLDTGRVRHWG